MVLDFSGPNGLGHLGHRRIIFGPGIVGLSGKANIGLGPILKIGPLMGFYGSYSFGLGSWLRVLMGQR